MSEKVQSLTAADWDREVLQSTGAVLVDFWAEWCAPCRMLGPVIDGLAEEYTGRLKVGKLNVDVSPDLAVRYGVRSIPTLLLFRDGQVVEQRVGVCSAAELRKLVESHITEKVVVESEKVDAEKVAPGA